MFYQKFCKVFSVALYTSAWIEITTLLSSPLSLLVALYTSAWIEIKVIRDVGNYQLRRTLHECVD